jgi:anti-sigma B factor antagonist
MKVERRDVEGVAVVSVAESLEVDLGNAEEFKASVLDALEGARDAVLDATRIEFFDSVGMGALLAIQKRLASAGGRMALAGLNETIGGIFKMVRLDVVFPIRPDVPQAIRALKST